MLRSNAKKIFTIIVLLILMLGIYYVYFLYFKPTAKTSGEQSINLEDYLAKDNETLVSNSITGVIKKITDETIVVANASEEVSFNITDSTITRKTNQENLFEIIEEKAQINNLVSVFFEQTKREKFAKRIDIINIKE